MHQRLHIRASVVILCLASTYIVGSGRCGAFQPVVFAQDLTFSALYSLVAHASMDTESKAKTSCSSRFHFPMHQSNKSIRYVPTAA